MRGHVQSLYSPEHPSVYCSQAQRDQTRRGLGQRSPSTEAVLVVTFVTSNLLLLTLVFLCMCEWIQVIPIITSLCHLHFVSEFHEETECTQIRMRRR